VVLLKQTLLLLLLLGQINTWNSCVCHSRLSGILSEH